MALALCWASEFFQNQALYPRARLALANLPSVCDALGTSELRSNLCRSKSINGFGEPHEQSQKKNAQSARKDLHSMHKVHSVSGMNSTLFKAYESTMTNAAGVTYPVRVINSREGVTFKDGTTGTALKVQEIHYRAPRSPYAEMSDKIHGTAFWTKAGRVA